MSQSRSVQGSPGSRALATAMATHGGILPKRSRLFAVILMALIAASRAEECPERCQCGQEVTYENRTLVLTNCSGLGLVMSPVGIPANTQYLDFTNNNLTEVTMATLTPLADLRVLDTRGNPDLTDIAIVTSQVNLTAIFTDNGATCCAYEAAWVNLEGLAVHREIRDVCRASHPQEECKRHLIVAPTMAIYLGTVLLSLVFNPWIITVNLGLPERRRDPFSLSFVYLSLTNVCFTVYAAVMFGYGVAYYDSYPRHMDQWLASAICTAVGFLMIFASLAHSMFYLIFSLHVFKLIYFAMHPGKQMTLRKFHAAVALSVALCVVVATIPLMDGTNHYNRVALCLPLHPGSPDDARNYSFNFVLFYTAVQLAILAIVGSLAFVLAHHFRVQKASVKGNDILEPAILAENRAFQKTVLIKVFTHIGLFLFFGIFLVMSCMRQFPIVASYGREWFARFYVLEAILWPVVSFVRRKRFLADTVRFLQRRGYYDWENQKISLTGTKFGPHDHKSSGS